MEINLVQITRSKDKTKYVCANFDLLLGTVAENDTGEKNLISVPVELAFYFVLFKERATEFI